LRISEKADAWVHHFCNHHDHHYPPPPPPPPPPLPPPPPPPSLPYNHYLYAGVDEACHAHNSDVLAIRHITARGVAARLMHTVRGVAARLLHTVRGVAARLLHTNLKRTRTPEGCCERVQMPLGMIALAESGSLCQNTADELWPHPLPSTPSVAASTHTRGELGGGGGGG
jgi:hypothetical protein